MAQSQNPTPKTSSLETVALTPTKVAGTKALSLTGSASLMTNYVPARSVDAGHRIAPIEDVQGNPIILSTGTEGALFAIMRSPAATTGWVQIDLTSSLGVGAVETFGVHPLASGTFAIAVSLVGQSGPRVFMATPPADPGAPAFDNPVALWTEVPTSLGLKSVSALTLGAGTDQMEPVVIATATKDGVNHDRYVVSGGIQPWDPAPIPQNAHRADGADPVLDLKIGTYPKYDLVGTYVLYWVGDTLQLGFDSLRTPANHKKAGDKIIHFDMPVPAETRAITAVDARAGGSDLFALADGVYHYSRDAQRAEAAPERIASLPHGSDGEITALADTTTIAIWCLRGGALSYMSGQVVESPDWSTLLPLRRDVGQIAALRNRTRQANQLFDVDASTRLSFFHQDPGSTIWHQTPIHLPDTGKVVAVPCYTTVLGFTDAGGAPWSGMVDLAATGLLYATVNGQSHALAPPGDPSTRVRLQTDALGRITILSHTTSASTQMIEVSGPGFAEVVDVNPAAIISENLQVFTDPTALSSAKTQTGAPVIGTRAKIGAQDAAQAFAKLTQAIAAATPKTLTLRQPGQSPANRIDPQRLQQAHPQPFALTVRPQVATFTGGLAEAAAAFTGADGLADDIKASFGDIWDSLTSGLETAAEWGLNLVETAAGKVLTFVVKLTKGLYHVALDTIEKALQALSWVFAQIEVGFEKLIEWLGAILGFDDILATQKVIVNSFDKVLDWTIGKAQDLKHTVDKGLDLAEAKIKAFKPGQAPDGTPLAVAQHQSRLDAGTADPHSPIGSFTTYHLQHSGALDAAPSINVALDKTITDFLEMVEQAGKAGVKGWKNLFTDMLSGLQGGTLNIGDLMKTVFADQLSGTINIAKIVADGGLDIAGDIVSLLKAILNQAMDIPFFSALFRLVTGTSDSLLNIFAFMAAIPATEQLRIAGLPDIASKAKPLTNSALTAEQFQQLIQADVDANGKITSETALVYNRIAGAARIQLSSFADAMTALDFATAKIATSVFKVFRVLFLALKVPLRLPTNTDGASKVLMVNYLFTALGVVGSIVSALALGPVGTAITSITTSLLSALVSYVTTVAVGIMAAASVKPDATEYLLIWATTSTNLCNAIEAGALAVLGALIAASDAGGQAEISAILVALAAVFMVWFVIRPILNTARLDLLIATGSRRPYWFG